MGQALGKGKGEHCEFIKRSYRRLRDYDVDRRHNDEFPKWFNSHVAVLLATENVAFESEQSSSSSSSSDETQTTLKMKVIPDPPASWHLPGNLPTTSRSGSTSHGSVSAGPSSSQATQKQTRGPTYVHGQWGTSEDGILKVVPNELNQVVEGHTSLASHLGVLARDGSLAPLTFTTWHYVPKQNKDNIWREIKAHTDADESMKRTIMASFGKKWRDWKSRVKTMGYKPFKNDTERLAHRPDRVHEDQWRALVYYWGTQSASKSSKKNRKIRKKKTLHHRTSRKPFSVVRLEETKKNNGVPASRSQVWMAAYMKDGTSNSDSVNEVMLAEHMEGSSTDPAALQEQIFTQVMGPERPGHVRTFGLGPSPTDGFGGGYRRSQEQNRLFQTQVVDSLSSHPTVRPMSHQQQSHAFSSQEYLDDPLKTTDQTRHLGLIATRVCRGTVVMLVSPTDGTDEIANPFIQPDGWLQWKFSCCYWHYSAWHRCVIQRKGIPSRRQENTLSSCYTLLRLFQAIEEFKKGKVEYRADKTGIIHLPFGKSDFSEEYLLVNLLATVKSPATLNAMLASSSETRTKWRKKKRKRDPQITRRPNPQDDDHDDDDEENEDDDDLDQQQQPEFEGLIARESEVLSDGGVRISHIPPMIKHTINRPHSSVLAIVALEKAIQCGEGKNLQNGVVLENVSHGQLQALSAVPADSPASAGDQGSSFTAAYVITPPPVMEGRGVVKRFGANRVHVVPMHADWFSPSTVHRLERQVVPHFFSGKSAEHRPEKYMECRNWIVAKYMENPEMRLSVDDFQELVAGIDIDDLTRIEDSNGEVHVPSAALKSIDSLIRFDKPKCRHKAASVYPSFSCHDGEESDLDSRIRERLSENRCNCCSCPLPIVYYQSQKERHGMLWNHKVLSCLVEKCG
ncbi:unnamed protein product [Camellia sinensis]